MKNEPKKADESLSNNDAPHGNAVTSVQYAALLAAYDYLIQRDKKRVINKLADMWAPHARGEVSGVASNANRNVVRRMLNEEHQEKRPDFDEITEFRKGLLLELTIEADKRQLQELDEIKRYQDGSVSFRFGRTIRQKNEQGVVTSILSVNDNSRYNILKSKVIKVGF